MTANIFRKNQDLDDFNFIGIYDWVTGNYLYRNKIFIYLLLLKALFFCISSLVNTMALDK